MNYKIAPFDYIERSTGIRALLKSTQTFILQKKNGLGYQGVAGMALGKKLAKYRMFTDKVPAVSGFPEVPPDSERAIPGGETVARLQTRFEIDRDETLQGFADRFANGDIFRSAGEMCDIFLVPDTSVQMPESVVPSGIKTKYNEMEAWWSGLGDDNPLLTGDNSREQPYAHLHARLTTKSNTYQVHMRVQALKQSPGSAAEAKWVEGTDQVIGEYRGSAILERYIDPNDSRLPDFAREVAAGNWDKANMDQFYRFRVVQTRQFNP